MLFRRAFLLAMNPLYESWVEERGEGAWQRRVSRGYLKGRRLGRGCRTLEGQGVRYGTQPHDWKLGELESMKNSLSFVWVFVSEKLPVIQSIGQYEHW